LKIVRPYANIIEPDLVAGALGRVEYAARVSHRSEDESGLNTEKFIRAVVLKHGDWSVVEHVQVSCEFLVDRGITHEIVRHRIGAYTQESTRFVNYAKKMPPSFIYPKPEVECFRCLGGDTPEFVGEGQWAHCNGASIQDYCPYDTDWIRAIEEAEFRYCSLLAKGWRPQEARSVLPNALASKIIITYNLRSWRHFFLMRTSKEAHPQMRQVTIPLLAEFQKLIPVLYEDIVPESRQVENIAKGR
jgi:thymidylate synthase (FAD)